MEKHPKPTEIKLHNKSRTLEIAFHSGENFDLAWEYLRVFSPSVTRVEPVGNYAIKLFFDDGHSSGIFDWRYLYELGENRDRNWAEHLQRLATGTGADAGSD